MSSLRNENPNPKETAIAVEEAPAGSETVSRHSALTEGERNEADSIASAKAENGASIPKSAQRQFGARWWALASGSALLLLLLTIAGAYVIMKGPSTVDNLVILTVPSGAEIRLGDKNYGQSPVKLEQVEKGTYTLTIAKDGFEPIIKEITVSESEPLEFKLKPIPPTDTVGRSPEEQIAFYRLRAEEAFARGRYGIPNEDSALYYTDLILGVDSSNEFAVGMRDRIRKALHQSAQTAAAQGNFGQAQELYALLVEYYPDDAEARAAAAKLESQLASRRGEVHGLVRRAEEALRSNNLIEPDGASAYYYSKQALAIDRQNPQARAVRNQVKEKLAKASEQAAARGDLDSAVAQLEKITAFFPEDKQLRSRLRELSARRSTEYAKASDPETHRLEGLKKSRQGNHIEAIPDLEYAMTNGRGTPDVVFALAFSYMKLGQLDKAAQYFRRVPPVASDSYPSAIAALGDIAVEKGDTVTGLERYKEARRLGGSILYSIASLSDRIEKIERQQRQKAAEPSPLTIQVKHNHGGVFGGSCQGSLTVNSTGVTYDGSEHRVSANLVGVGARVAKGEMVLQLQNKSEKFKVLQTEGERFREMLTRYQNHAPSSQ